MNSNISLCTIIGVVRWNEWGNGKTKGTNNDLHVTRYRLRKKVLQSLCCHFYGSKVI